MTFDSSIVVVMQRVMADFLSGMDIVCTILYCCFSTAQHRLLDVISFNAAEHVGWDNRIPGIAVRRIPGTSHPMWLFIAPKGVKIAKRSAEIVHFLVRFMISLPF